MDINYSLFEYQFAIGELALGKQPLSRQDALKTVINEDFLRLHRFVFSNKVGRKKYVREYMWAQEKVVIVFKFGYLRNVCTQKPSWDVEQKSDFPHCVVVVSLENSSPYIVIANYESSFKDASEVAKLIEHGLNSSFYGRGLLVKIKPCGSKNTDAELWADYMFKTYSQARIYKALTEESLEKYEQNNKKSDFRQFVVEEDKADEVMTLLHKYIRGKKKPKDIMRPLRAAIYANAISPDISINDFRKEFGNIMDRYSSLFSKYKKKETSSYDNDDLYKDMKEKFIKIMNW